MPTTQYHTFESSINSLVNETPHFSLMVVTPQGHHRFVFDQFSSPTFKFKFAFFWFDLSVIEFSNEGKCLAT